MKFTFNLSLIKYRLGIFFKYFFLIVLVLGGIYFIIQYVYSVTNSPLKVRVTNVTGRSATISWITDRADKGVVLVNTKDEFYLWSGHTKGYDDRDYSNAITDRLSSITKGALENADSDFNADVNAKEFEDIKVTKLGKYYVHHATIFNLEPNTEYFFKVSNGLRSWGINSERQKFGEYEFSTVEKFAFKTFQDPSSVPTPDPAYGKVLSGTYNKDGFIEDNLNTDSVVFAYAYGVEKDTSNVLSSVTNKDAGWTIDKSNFRKSNGELTSNYYQTNRDYIKIFAQVENIKEVYQNEYIWGFNDSPADNILGGVPDKYRGNVFEYIQVIFNEKVLQSKLIDAVSSSVYAGDISGQVCSSSQFGKKKTEGDYECQCIPGGASGRWSCSKIASSGGSGGSTFNCNTCNPAKQRCNNKKTACIDNEAPFSCDTCAYGCDSTGKRCNTNPPNSVESCDGEYAKGCNVNDGCFCKVYKMNGNTKQYTGAYKRLTKDCRPASCASGTDLSCQNGNCQARTDSGGNLCSPTDFTTPGCERTSGTQINKKENDCKGTFVKDIKSCTGDNCLGTCYNCQSGSSYNEDLKKCVVNWTDPGVIPGNDNGLQEGMKSCPCPSGKMTPDKEGTFSISEMESCADYQKFKCSLPTTDISCSCNVGEVFTGLNVKSKFVKDQLACEDLKRINPCILSVAASTDECAQGSGKVCDTSTGKWSGKCLAPLVPNRATLTCVAPTAGYYENAAYCGGNILQVSNGGDFNCIDFNSDDSLNTICCAINNETSKKTVEKCIEFKGTSVGNHYCEWFQIDVCLKDRQTGSFVSRRLIAPVDYSKYEFISKGLCSVSTDTSSGCFEKSGNYYWELKSKNISKTPVAGIGSDSACNSLNPYKDSPLESACFVTANSRDWKTYEDVAYDKTKESTLSKNQCGFCCLASDGSYSWENTSCTLLGKNNSKEFSTSSSCPTSRSELTINRSYDLLSLNSQSVLGTDTISYFPEPGLYMITENEKEYKFNIPDTSSNILLLKDPNQNYNSISSSDIIDYTNAEVKIERISKSYTLKLSKGLNLISLPGIVSINGNDIISASQLIKLLNFNGQVVNKIAYYEGGRWISGVGNNKSENVYVGNDFSLVPGRGYLLEASLDSQTSLPILSFKTSIPIALSSGWNLVGVNGYKTSYTAKSFIDSINSVEGLTADNVTWWPTSKGRYEGLQVSEGTTYGFDFPIAKDLGYFVRVVKFDGPTINTKSIIWNPGGELHGKPGSN